MARKPLDSNGADEIIVPIGAPIPGHIRTAPSSPGHLRAVQRSITPDEPIEAQRGSDESAPDSVWPPDSGETMLRELRALARDFAEHRGAVARARIEDSERMDRIEAAQEVGLVRIGKLEASVKRAGAIVSAISATSPAWGPTVVDALLRVFGG